MQPSAVPTWSESAQMMSAQPQSGILHGQQVAPTQMISGSSTPYQNFANPRIIVETNSKPRLRFYNALLGLAITQLVLAGIAVIVGLTAFFVLTDDDDDKVIFDVDFSGLWVGGLYILACSCGIGSLRISSGYRCLLVSYFVLLVISIVLTPVLLGWSSVWINVAGFYNCDCSYDDLYCDCSMAADLVLNSILLILGILLMITSTISTAFLCCNWHCGQCCAICCGCKPKPIVDAQYASYPQY